MRRIAALLLIFAGSLAEAADLPPVIQADTDASFASCREAGGTPSLLPGYLTSLDLNGDEAPDYIVNLMGLNCEGAASYFCGSAGCPVTVWLSGKGGLTAAWTNHAQDIQIDRTGPHPIVVAALHGQLCDPPRAGVDGCELRLDFQGKADAAEKPAPGWSLRSASGSTPVALIDGPGNIKNLALFCLSGEPFLATIFRESPKGETARLEFDFSAGPLAATARREPTAGGAFVIALRKASVAQRLAGRDSSVMLKVDGREQGVLSLAGSSKAIRAALETCAPG